MSKKNRKLITIILLLFTFCFMPNIANGIEIDTSTAYTDTSNHTHEWSSTTCSKQGKCQICGATKIGFAEHKFKTLDSGKEKCVYCGVIQEAQGETYKCNTCNQKFDTQEEYDAHMTRHTDLKKYNVTTQDSVIITNVTTSVKYGDLLCPICLTYKVTTAEDLLNHVASAHNTGFTCPHCGTNFDTNQKKVDHINDKHLAQWANEQAYKEYSQKTWDEKADSFSKWNYQHTLEGVATIEGFAGYTCSYCGVVIMQYQAFLTHMQSEGSTLGLDIYTCSYCQKDFFDYAEFEKHYKEEYNKNTPGVCSLCLQEFPNLTELHAHQEKEAEAIKEKLLATSYKCGVCGNVYSDFEEAKKCAYSDAEKIIGTNRYCCQTCGIDFNSFEELKSHVDTEQTKYEEAINKYNAWVRAENERRIAHNEETRKGYEKIDELKESKYWKPEYDNLPYEAKLSLWADFKNLEKALEDPIQAAARETIINQYKANDIWDDSYDLLPNEYLAENLDRLVVEHQEAKEAAEKAKEAAAKYNAERIEIIDSMKKDQLWDPKYGFITDNTELKNVHTSLQQVKQWEHTQNTFKAPTVDYQELAQLCWYDQYKVDVFYSMTSNGVLGDESANYIKERNETYNGFKTDEDAKKYLEDHGYLVNGVPVNDNINDKSSYRINYQMGSTAQHYLEKAAEHAWTLHGETRNFTQTEAINYLLEHKCEYGI